MSNSAPGFSQHPDHTVEIENHKGLLTILVNNEVIGETRKGLKLLEANYPEVFYLPIDTIPDEMLEPSEHTSYCPFKGEAKYWNLVVDGERLDNAVWGYPEPYNEVVEIAGHIAFYPQYASVESRPNDD